MEARITHRAGFRTWTEAFPMDQAAAALSLLDGREVSELEVVGPGETGLLVGGGPDLFTVTAVMGPDAFLDVVADVPADGEVDLLVGGQRTSWPRRLCASREQVVAAVSGWVATGSPNPALRWRRQGSEL